MPINKSNLPTESEPGFSKPIRLKCPRCKHRHAGLNLTQTAAGFQCTRCGLRKPADFWREPFEQWRRRHPQHDFLGFTEAARLIGTCPTALRNAVRNHRIVAKKISRHLWVVTITELENFYAYTFRHRRRSSK